MRSAAWKLTALAVGAAIALAGCKRSGHDNPSGPRPPAAPGSGPAAAPPT
jgi:hypothetical protein